MSKATTVWQPGQSGNPKGRPPGKGDSALLRASIQSHLPQVIDMLVNKALDGDTNAASLLLSRGLAPLKPTEVTYTLPMTDSSLSGQGKSVLNAVASGDLPVTHGASILGALGALSKLVEVDDLIARISALEARQGTSVGGV